MSRFFLFSFTLMLPGHFPVQWKLKLIAKKFQKITISLLTMR